MTDLATSTDIEARLGRTLTTLEATRVVPLLTDASASVRNYTRQTITQVTDDVVRLKIRNGRVRLPQRPATAVTTVKNTLGDLVLFQWDGGSIVVVGSNVPDTFAWVPWLNGMAAVDVTYTHGYSTVPDDIVGVVCSIVMRALGREPLDAGITSETIQGYSYSLGSAGAAGAFGLLSSEADILDAYRREQTGSVNMMPFGII